MRKKNIPIVRRVRLSDGGLITKILGTTKAGQSRLEFPYDIPPISVNLTPETKKTLLYTSAILGGSVVLSIVINKLI